MKAIRQNFTLILAILIPTVMILTIFFTIKMSTRQAKSTYNFVYAVDNDPYRSKSIYRVSDNKIEKVDNAAYFANIPDPKPPIEISEPKLYLHNTGDNTNTSLTFEEAQKFNLKTDSNSPDGFKVRRGGEDFNVFSILTGVGDSYNNYYLVRDNTALELNLETGIEHYMDIAFLGWVTN